VSQEGVTENRIQAMTCTGNAAFIDKTKRYLANDLTTLHVRWSTSGGV